MMKRHRTYWVIAALGISAIAYYLAAFGLGHAISSTTRFRIILAMLFAQSVGFVVLGAFVVSLVGELRPYQRAASQLALLKGMWRALDIANDKGGLTPEARDDIYKEADAVFGRYSDVMKEGDKGA